MKNDIVDSKIMDEKEEWSFIMNNNNNYEINKKYLNNNLWKEKEKGNLIDIRQDNIKLFEIVCSNNNNFNLEEIKNKMINIKIEENEEIKKNKDKDKEKDKDILKFYNNKIYISQLHLNSKIINDEVMSNLELIINPLINQKKIIHKFRRGPIK